MKSAISALLLAAFFGLCDIVVGRYWPGMAISNVLIWPSVFGLAILPGVLIGRRMQTWQSCVVTAETITIVVAAILAGRSPNQFFQWEFGMQLAIVHLALFPPLLLSLLMGKRSTAASIS
jgi:hypothetical protein